LLPHNGLLNGLLHGLSTMGDGCPVRHLAGHDADTLLPAMRLDLPGPQTNPSAVGALERGGYNAQ
jgi:hypothetical protein